MPIEFKKTKFLKNLGKKYKLVTHIERAIAAEDRAFTFEYVPKKGDNAWHPSGHCTPIVSELFDAATEEKQPRGGNKTFPVGHFWHAFLQHVVVDRLGFAEPNSVERVGVKGWAQGETSKYKAYHWVRGAGDIAPCSIPEEGDWVVDFKTMSSSQFKQLDIPDWIAAKYECQINIYMDLFGLDQGLIIGINKDAPHDMKEYVFTRNDKLISEIYDKWEFVGECIDLGERPSAQDDDVFPHAHGPRDEWTLSIRGPEA